jgi:hypothetical protein
MIGIGFSISVKPKSGQRNYGHIVSMGIDMQPKVNINANVKHI